jgi:nitrogen fixation NifU-like protein
MEDQLYREIILDHWKNPQNYGVIADADIDISDNNPLCGDEIRITAKIQNNKLTEILFISEGCAISRASASLFTEKIKGMSIEEIKKITPEEVVEELGVPLTPTRTKCALLLYSTLQRGLKTT